MPTQTSLGVPHRQLLPPPLSPTKRKTHQNQRRVIKLVLAVDIDAHGDELLAFLQIALPTCQQEIVKLRTRVEGVLVSQHAAFYQQALFAQFAFQLMLSQHHLSRMLFLLYIFFYAREKKREKERKEKGQCKAKSWMIWKVVSMSL